jgi:hypothetical protein
MTEAQVKVFLALLLRSDLQGHLDVTVSELARLTGHSRATVRSALQWLESPACAGEQIDPYIERSGKSIVIPKFVAGSDKKMTFSDEEEDGGQRIADLEKTITRLHNRIAQLESGDESGLAEELPPEIGKSVRDVEYTLGRALSPKETFYLGQMFDRFGPKLVLSELRKRKKAKDPLRATYGVLNSYTKQREGSKKTVDIKAPPPVAYADVAEGIWD